MDSLSYVLKKYISPVNQSADLQKAKTDLHAIKDFLHENLETVKRNKVPIPYSSVQTTRYLDEATRIEEANFDLVVKIEEKDFKVQGSGSGSPKITGLSKNMETYSGNFKKFQQRFQGDVHGCLREFVQERDEFAGRISIIVHGLQFQIIVDEIQHGENDAQVPCLSAKRVDYEPPWFTINLKAVVTNGENSYMIMPMPGTLVPAWIEYREDPVDPDSRSIQVLLRAILYCEPFLCHRSSFDIVASAAALYASTCKKRASLRGVNSAGDWDNLEECLLCVLDDLHKAYKRRQLPYHMCPGVNLLGDNTKKAGNKFAKFLHELMLNHCDAMKKIVSRHLQPKDDEE